MNSSLDVFDFLAFLYMSPGDLWLLMGVPTLLAGCTLLVGSMLLAGGWLLVPDEALNLFLTERSPESFLPRTFLFDL